MVLTLTLQLTLKRIIDVTVSLVMLAVFALPLAVIALALKLESTGPVIFKQERAGKDGKPFVLYKLRSMKTARGNGPIFHDEQSVTSVGGFIRRWRIDEMPQFVNVLKGEMSIIGPRPTLPYQAERYDSEQRKRLNVSPGLTGWSQIHGDSAISWPDRITLDVWYVDNWSLCLDLKIMLLTPAALLRIRKINVEEGPPPDEISDLPVNGGRMEN